MTWENWNCFDLWWIDKLNEKAYWYSKVMLEIALWVAFLRVALLWPRRRNNKHSYLEIGESQSWLHGSIGTGSGLWELVSKLVLTSDINLWVSVKHAVKKMVISLNLAKKTTESNVLNLFKINNLVKPCW